MLTIQNSYTFSLFVQCLSILIFYLTYNLETKPFMILLNNAYLLEYIVSIIEFFGYILLGYYLNTKTNLTLLRYADWFVTTNILLVSLSLFLIFNNIYCDEYLSLTEKNHKLEQYTFQFLQKEYMSEFLKIMFFNTSMLIFGFLGELNVIQKNISLGFGLMFFALSFYYVVTNFAKNFLINNVVLGIFIFIWLLYAVAFTMKFDQKNIAYNFLDLISKNMFGIFLFFYMKYGVY